jgi:hypothetical protein
MFGEYGTCCDEVNLWHCVSLTVSMTYHQQVHGNTTPICMGNSCLVYFDWHNDIVHSNCVDQGALWQVQCAVACCCVSV